MIYTGLKYLLKKVDRGERGGQKLLILRRHCLWTAPKNYLDSEHFLSRRPSFGQKRKLSVELPNGHFTLTKKNTIACLLDLEFRHRLSCMPKCELAQ